MIERLYNILSKKQLIMNGEPVSFYFSKNGYDNRHLLYINDKIVIAYDEFTFHVRRAFSNKYITHIPSIRELKSVVLNLLLNEAN